MAQIKNISILVYDLDHVYIADCEDDNAERRMLMEAQVSKVTIKSDGTVDFLFKVAGKTSSVTPEEITLYQDIATYKSTSKKYELTYSTVGALLGLLGVPEAAYMAYKPSANSYIYIVPKGFIINDSTMIEQSDFPDSWEFTRIEESGSIKWEHNANFYNKTIYTTKEEALVNHKIKLLKLNGVEVEV